jgi:ABC-2 type transport system ATP-binding protein
LTTDNPAIAFDGLTKRYRSGRLALDSLSLEVPPGEVFGFLGPNGAGKTTTIRLMLDLIRPTGGSVQVFGEDCNRNGPLVRKRIGYLPGDLSLYPSFTGDRLLTLFGSLRPESIRQAYVRELCERLDVTLGTPMRELSHGNRQKVGIVLALMAEPDLIILDEPTSGLDPLAQHRVLDILREASGRGSTVFFSSHNLPEVERICDRVAMVRDGRLVAVERVGDVTSRAVTLLQLTFAEPVPPDAFGAVSGARETTRSDDGRLVHLEVMGEVDALVKTLARFHVVAVKTEEPSLEQAFLAMYEGAEPSEIAR